MPQIKFAIDQDGYLIAKFGKSKMQLTLIETEYCTYMAHIVPDSYEYVPFASNIRQDDYQFYPENIINPLQFSKYIQRDTEVEINGKKGLVYGLTYLT